MFEAEGYDYLPEGDIRDAQWYIYHPQAVKR